MAHQAPWLVLLDRLAQHLDAHRAEKAPDADRKARNNKYVKILEDVCTVVRDAEMKASPDLAGIVEKAHTILDRELQWAYSQGGFSFVPTFAHSDDAPLVEDALENAGACRTYDRGLQRPHLHQARTCWTPSSSSTAA